MTREIVSSGEAAEISGSTPMDAKEEGGVGRDNSSDNASSPRVPWNGPLDDRWKTEPKQYGTHVRSLSWLQSSYGPFHFSFLQSIQTLRGWY